MKKKWENFWKGKEARVTWSKRRVMKIIEKHAKGKVLEVGSGSGFYSKFFVDKGCDVTALDYSKRALEMTKKLDKRIKIREGDARKMPFKSNTFDVVFSDGLLEHFKNPTILLKEFNRVLKNGGKVITIVPNKISYWVFVKPFKMRELEEYRFDLMVAMKLHKKTGFNIIDAGGISVLPISRSPEFMGNRFGRLLYVIGEKVRK